MAGILICPSHGSQPPVSASARLRDALSNGVGIPESWVSLVVIKSVTRISVQLVDSALVLEAGLNPAASPFVLFDRDIAQKKLNDRLLIRTLIPSELNTPRVCGRCLAEAIQPQGTKRLSVDAGVHAGQDSSGTQTPSHVFPNGDKRQGAAAEREP